MKPLAVILLSCVAIATSNVIKDSTEISEWNPVYGYLNRFAIPEAERIENAEAELLKNPNSRIFNGMPARLGEFKYQAGLIGAFEGSTRRSVCGASLVSTSRLLTAAHCWYDGENQVSSFTVVLGSVLLFHGGVRVQTSDVVVHPRWFPLLIRNDIAVIKLGSPVELSENVGTVRLPRNFELFDSFAGVNGIASGFGITNDGASISDDQSLNYGVQPILTNEYCQNFLSEIVFQDSNICTRTVGGASPCPGDSGGPLAVLGSGGADDRILVGIVSFGLRWCTIGFPAVFVRVTSYMGFILEHVTV